MEQLKQRKFDFVKIAPLSFDKKLIPYTFKKLGELTLKENTQKPTPWRECLQDFGRDDSCNLFVVVKHIS